MFERVPLKFGEACLRKACEGLVGGVSAMARASDCAGGLGPFLPFGFRLGPGSRAGPGTAAPGSVRTERRPSGRRLQPPRDRRNSALPGNCWPSERAVRGQKNNES